jgi:hypothetical protein
MFKKLLICLSLCIVFLNTFADSPITSTDFFTAYLDVPIVKDKSILDKEAMIYLYEPSNPIDVKLALINKIGWDHKSHNSEKFLEYIRRNMKYKSRNNFKFFYFKDHASADNLICYSYLKAMDNYFYVETAYHYSKLATEKNPSSYAVNLISAIIKAQIITSLESPCELFKATDDVRRNVNLKKDLRPEAEKLIFEYMDIYKKGCH